jgi:hypothetical protein
LARQKLASELAVRHTTRNPGADELCEQRLGAWVKWQLPGVNLRERRIHSALQQRSLDVGL